MGACPHQLDHPQGTLVCPDPLRGIWQGHWDEAPEGQYTMSGCPHFHSIKGGSPANPQGLLIGLQSWPRHKPQAPLPCSVTWSKGDGSPREALGPRGRASPAGTSNTGSGCSSRASGKPCSPRGLHLSSVLRQGGPQGPRSSLKQKVGDDRQAPRTVWYPGHP